MPRITIDGREIEAQAGTTVLEAALSQGAEIPHYCYHPGLSIAGNCRMCLVEMEKAPKLVIACATRVADGVVIRTETERVKAARRAVMEFLLINHPLDCTICDQAGECRLQEYAVEYGQGTSRTVEPKLLLNKAVDLGQHVMLDQERCIQCSRCIRFCDEVSKTGELAFFRRGERTVIGIYPGRPLDNPYSGNTVDICPVGALTLKEFRFQTRVWYLNNTPGICAGCARGCNVMIATGKQPELWTTRGQFDDRIKRLVPRVNPEVNAHWMCDEGRLSFKRLEAVPRLTAAQAGDEAADYDETVRQIVDRLRAAGGRAAAVFSPRLTCESLYAWRKLLEALGPIGIAVRRLQRGTDDRLLIRADKGANSRGAEWILGSTPDERSVLDAASRGDLDTLLVFGDPLDPADTAVLDDDPRAQRCELLYVGPFLDAAARRARLKLPACAWAEEEGSFVNFEGRVQWTRRAHLARGEARPAWRIAADLGAAGGIELPDWTSATDVFLSLAAEVAPFDRLTPETLGLLGLAARAAAATA